MLDACYTAKRVRDLLPSLPEGVTASYIRYLDAIREAEAHGQKLKASDISDILGIRRPIITRTIHAMERDGYISKIPSEDDGRIMYLTATEKGRKLSEQFDTEYFEQLVPYLETITEQEAYQMIRTINRLYNIMSGNDQSSSLCANRLSEELRGAGMGADDEA